jgi:hypothetical protein
VQPVPPVIRLSKEARRWRLASRARPLQAKAFYATILAAIVIGAIANVLTISPMRALVWIAVINGIVAVPVMTLLMLMAVNARVIGRFTVSGPVLWLGSLAAGLMAAAAIGWAASWFMGAAHWMCSRHTPAYPRCHRGCSRRKPDRLGNRVRSVEDRMIRLSMQIKVMVMES